MYILSHISRHTEAALLFVTHVPSHHGSGRCVTLPSAFGKHLGKRLGISGLTHLDFGSNILGRPPRSQPGHVSLRHAGGPRSITGHSGSPCRNKKRLHLSSNQPSETIHAQFTPQRIYPIQSQTTAHPIQPPTTASTPDAKTWPLPPHRCPLRSRLG